MRAARRARPAVVAVILGSLAVAAAAQPGAPPATPPCAACARGDALIARFSLQPLRPLATQLAAVRLLDPVPPQQYASLVEIRNRHAVLVRIGVLEEADLADVAASLCHADHGACVEATTRTLRCLAERCVVDLPTPDPHTDLVELPENCHQYSTRRRSPPYGLGFDWGTGWQRSQYPTDHRAWSLGIEGRLRFGRHLGATARVDRVNSRDEAIDTDGNGYDDMSTGPITRISMLAGPSIVLDNTRYDSTTRFLRLDLLGGYVSTRSQADESGPAAGVDLAYQLSGFRFGARVVQGFGAAREATMVVGHLGIVSGAAPAYRNEADCGAQSAARSSRLALGLDIPLVGAGLSSHLGYLVPGVGVELLWHLVPKLDAVTHADLLIYPGYERSRVIQQAVLAGFRIDHKRRHHTHFFTAVMAGYSLGSGLDATSGPVIDLSFAWGGQDREGGGHLRIHGRFGVGTDNRGEPAIFLSGGGELHLDPQRWHDRS